MEGRALTTGRPLTMGPASPFGKGVRASLRRDARSGGGSAEKTGGPREVEPLAIGDAQGPKRGKILRGLDPLGRDRRVDSLGETDERPRKRLAGGVAGD